MRELSVIDKKEIYRYLGYNPDSHVITEDIDELVDDCIKEVIGNSSPKAVCSKALSLHTEGGCLYAGTLLLEGNDIKEHLKNCTHAVLMAVTLGSGIDALIRKTEAVDMAKAVIIDSAANTAVEAAGQMAENELREKLSSEGRYLTSRYSPGYGDFPINIQKELLRLTDAPRKIGLSVTQSNIMTPKKSITAVLGVADISVKGKPAGCAHCVLKEKCIFRKKGTTCAVSD